MPAKQATYHVKAAKMAGLAVIFALLAGGCDSSDPPTSTGPSAGQSGAVAAASAGAAAVAGANVTPPAPAAPVPCGAVECGAPKNIAADLLRSVTGLSMTGAETVGCCLEESTSTCSAAPMAGVSCDLLAVSEPRCPGVDLSALVALVGGLGPNAQTMLGCCTRGMCGQDGALFGRGCVENGDAKRMLSAIPVVGPLIKVPPPMPCPAADSDGDAGM